MTVENTHGTTDGKLLPGWADSEEEMQAWFNAMYDVSRVWGITEEEAEVFLEKVGFQGYDRLE